MVKLFYVFRIIRIFRIITGRDHYRHSLRKLLCCAGLVLFLTSPVSAQQLLEQQLSAYTGKNGSAYVAPLVDAFNADLNAGLFHSAHISRAGLRLSLEFRFMSVYFTDKDRTFLATTEGNFRPEQTVEVPTVVGSSGAVYVEGEGGTRYAFPGGFDLDSFPIIVPQLRIGSVYGTEMLARYFAFNPGNIGFGALNLYGFGLRHSISHHIGARIPVALAAGIFWQRFSMGRNERGDDLVTAEAFTAGLQVSKRIGELEPYASIAYDALLMDVEYVARLPNVIDETFEYDDVEFSFNSSKNFHVTLGMAFHLAFMSAHGEYNIGGQNSLSFGLAFQYHP
jgi:hypothetical protein